MNILSIETSSPYTYIGLSKDSTPVFEIRNFERFTHVEKLSNMTEWILKTNNIDFGDLSYIVVSVGPGYFTSLRAGISFAKGLSFSCNIPLLPVSTFAGFLFELERKDVSVAYRLKGSNVFFQEFKNGSPMDKLPIITNLKDIAPSFPLFVMEFPPSASVISKVAFEQYIAGKEKVPNPKFIEPLYIQNPVS